MFHSNLRVPFQSLLRRFVRHSSYHTSSVSYHPMELMSVVQVLEKIAPTGLAEDWDNVGLLLEPQSSRQIQCVFITNDLTEPVLDEALSLPTVGLIIAYHPPIFQSFKRLTQSSAKERILLKCVQAGIAVYSPHTALDNMEGGINEWLLSGVGEGVVSSIGARRIDAGGGKLVKCSGVDSKRLAELCKPYKQVEIRNNNELYCNDHDLVNLLPSLRKLSPANLTINTSTDVEVVPSGGRLLKLSQQLSLTQIITKVKAHLQLPHLRVAMPTEDRPISSVASCAGSGGSVLRGVHADLYLTGEMSHHQVLEANAQGRAVILCDHSNSERGFLQDVYCKSLSESLHGVEIVCSSIDRDPLQVV